MGADHDAHAALGEALLHLARLGGLAQPRELADLDAEASKAAAEGLHMLAGEHRGRRDDGDLTAGHGDDGGRPQRDLRLPEADIAADQPVHRPTRGEIVQRLVDSRRLVGTLRIGEARDETVVIAGLWREGGSRRLCARLAQLGQPDGGLLDLGFDLGTPLLPGIALQLVERNGLFIRAVAPDQAKLANGGQESRVVGIFQPHDLAGFPGRVDGLQPAQHAHAVVEVNDGVADVQLRLLELQRGEDRLPVGARALAENVAGRDDGDLLLGKREALLDRQQHGHHAAGLGRDEGIPILGGGDRLAEALLHALDERAKLALIFGGEDRLAAPFGMLADEGRRRRCRSPALGEARQRLGLGADVVDLAACQGLLPGRLVEIERVGRQQAALAFGAEPGRELAMRLECLAGLLQEAAAALLGGLHPGERGTRHIVEQRLEPGVELRQPVLGAGEALLLGPLAQHDLGRRQQQHGVQLIAVGALGERIEIADLRDPAILMLDAQRPLAPCGKDVHYLPANGRLARLVYAVVGDIAGAG
jgi:hypothetical protein